MRLVLVRHGQTEWNRTHRLQGSSDIPLNATGLQQAEATAQLLADVPWDAIVSSPLGRARETAEAIAGRTQLPVGRAYGNLTEREFGPAEGEFSAYAERRWPGLESALFESRSEVAARGLLGLEEIYDDHPAGNVVAVSHGFLIQLTLSVVVGSNVGDIDNAAFSVLERQGDGWMLTALNQTSSIMSGFR